MKNEPKSLGFIFEEIPMADAENIVSAGDGKYSDLILMLAKKLPELEAMNQNGDDQKAFAFGPSQGQALEEKERKALCHTVNLRLTKIGVNWSVRYSGNRKVFICVPKRSSKSKALAPHLGVSSQRAIRSAPVKTKELRSQSMSSQELVSFAREVLGYMGPFNRTPASVGFKKAVAIVAHEDLSIKDKLLDPALGFKKGGADFIRRKGQENVKTQVEQLRYQLKQKGVIQ